MIASSSDAPRVAALLAIGLGFAVSLAMNLPGHMSYDSVIQLAQGRTGVYNNWHPPVMAWLLGVFDAVVRGTALFVVFDSLLLYGALAVVLFAAPRTSWLAAPLLVVWAAMPDGLIYPGIVWKDVLFAATAVAGFALLALAARLWRRRPWRFWLIVASFLVLALAALSRQNGLVVLPAGAVACGWIAARQGGHKPIHSALAYALLPLAGAGILVIAASAELQAHNDGEPSQVYQLKDLEAYDLAGALQADPGLKLDRLKAANPTLERLMRTKGARAYTPLLIDSISGMSDLQDALLDTPLSVVSAQWRDLILGHPWLYVKVRAQDFGWMFLTPQIDRCLPFFVGVDGPEPWMSQLGLVNRQRPQDDALTDWGEPWAHTPLLWHGTYALMAIVLIVLLLRRGRPSDIAMAGLQAAGLLFTSTFLIVAVACDYRYLYMLDVAAIAGAIYLAADPSGVSLRRRPPAAS